MNGRRPEIPCAECGTPFWKPDARTRTCSPECYRASITLSWTFYCNACGVQFQTPHGFQRFCTKACAMGFSVRASAASKQARRSKVGRRQREILGLLQNNPGNWISTTWLARTCLGGETRADLSLIVMSTDRLLFTAPLLGLAIERRTVQGKRARSENEYRYLGTIEREVAS